MKPDETASASGYASWSWTVVCLFISGIVVGSFIAGMLLNWKPLLSSKFWALLGYQDEALVITEGSSSSPRGYKYDVFLSFRGSDTRRSFVDYLYRRLLEEGILAFKDEKELNRGEIISSKLLQTIKDSRISIVVFSRGYARSKWCLDELVAIVDCHKEMKQELLPVFYDVDPRDVRYQTGPYEDAFDSHRERFREEPDKIYKWKSAMTYLSNISGLILRDQPETEAIGNIIQTVEQLFPKFPRPSSHSQGWIQSRLDGLEKLLKLEDDCILVVGIWGMGGSGKTTHALALYNRIFEKFEGACFIQDVSQVYRVGGATALQKQILCESLNVELSDIYNPLEISDLLRKLYRKKILIVLDGVDELRQLDLLAINRNMLGKGSRIIITTRNRHILDAYKVDFIHEISLLNNDEARELFLSACGIVDDQDYTRLIPRVLEYAHGLPLAIKVLGSFLQYRDVTFWEDTLDRLRREPSFEIMKTLQTSFDGLDDEDREIFLHIACFFHGKKVDFVKEVLSCCGFLVEIGIQTLLDKSLITIQNEEIHMHDLLQDLGKKIVHEEYPNNPGLRSRLWLYEDFSFVLKSNTATSKVKDIVLYEDASISEYEDLNIEGLSKIRNLELLILYDLHFSGRLTSLPNELRYLFWHGYPFYSLPSLEPYNRLVGLNLPNSNIERPWYGCKDFPHLERVDLSYSKYLRETPNFEGSPRLKRLDFTGCRELMEVHPSIGHLKELAYLSFRDCDMLVTLNLDHKCKLSSLKVLDLYSCRHLENTPDFTGLPNVEHIDLGKCESLSTVHHSIGNLEKLKFLNVPADIDLPKLGGVRIIRTP
ncbi:hypothetical protein AHAS_Ahas18G0104000 [Arachis hypogaea]